MVTRKPKLLEGIRILDLTTIIMGPFATHILADLGADVIKVEPPEGDSTRTYPPHLVPGVTGSFLNLHRNKRSVVLNLKSSSDANALRELIATADVLVHNLRVQSIRRLGFDYEQCRAICPDIVYCAAYGFGAEGPYGEKAAYDDLMQAASGFSAAYMLLGKEPAYAPAVIFDKIAGQAVATAIVTGLLHRERTGEGQSIEVPMFETAVEFNLMEAFSLAAFEPAKGPGGYARLASQARRPYRTADGYVCILPFSDRNWRAFFAFIGREDLSVDPRYAQLRERAENIDDLYRLIAEIAPSYSTQEWLTFCDTNDVPCARVNTIEDLFTDPHMQAVRMFESAEHSHGGRYKVVRRATNYSAAPFVLHRHAPMLGEHTDEVLAEAAEFRRTGSGISGKENLEQSDEF